MLVKVCHSLVLLQFWWQGCHKGGFGLHPGGGLISLLPACGLQPPVCSDTGARTGGGLGGKNQEGRGVMGLEQQVGSKADPPQEGRGFE